MYRIRPPDFVNDQAKEPQKSTRVVLVIMALWVVLLLAGLLTIWFTRV